jgi:thiol-disulfide isomerase/thioredoxin
MTDVPPPDTALPPAREAETAPGAGAPPSVRKPRKRFILIGLGIGLLIILLIGLLTSIGTSSTTTSAPRQGGAVPSFTGANLGPTGSPEVSVPADGGGNGTPAVLLFFGAWCSSCHQELPPLAAAVRKQDQAHGALSRIRVIGVDSFDKTSTAKSFIHAAGVTFPVASDPGAGITSGLFYFDGDPYAVFVNGDGTIAKIVRGAVLTPSSLTADERALIPSGT